MKRINSRIGKVLTSLILITVVSSCDLFNLDINTDPNNPQTVTPDLLLPSVMYNASNTFAAGLNTNATGFVGGMIVSAEDWNLNQSSYVGTWSTLYTGPLKDLDEVIKFCRNAGNQPGYLGIALVLKAYYFSMMVDLWGDVPYFDAFNGNNLAKPNQNPKYDSGADVYADLLASLDEAVTSLNAVDPVDTRRGDPIFGFNSGSTTIQRAKWVATANSLKLRMLIQTRRVSNNSAAIQAVLAQPLITASADDFQFQFGRLLNPDNRHPWYQNAYTGAENGFNYFGHQIMFEMIRDRDPRLPFYFKRQRNTVLNFNDPTERNTATCTTAPCYYGYFPVNGNALGLLQAAGVISNPLNATDRAFLAGYFGRDRGDRSGVPLDGSYRTAPGVYPAGGFYDDGAFAANGTASRAVRSNNAFGNGIFPMITSYNIQLYRAEALLTGLVPGGASAARSLINLALRAHIAKVVSFGQSLDASSVAPSTAAIEAFVATQLAFYDGAGDDTERLNRTMKIAWFCNFGNGYEIYNAYRRTGFPNSNWIRPQIQAPVRGFPNRLPYSLDDLTLNSSVTDAQRSIAFDVDKVFWAN
ncbi:MAG: SusD/RagB family nutrient-binding outer membrane lipoprotein [Cyclobacteriaceae bacterium]|nr:SusD/RagB family nutrient-binding outer membrane lipoprotein [Cyclobacteriaceae bacterium]